VQIPLKDVIVGKRFRTQFVDIDKLAESISKFGLIEPVVLDEKNNLIAGERRVRAHQLLKMEVIEVRYMNDLGELEKKEIELEENIQRNAFTWQEEVTAKNQLHKLKQQIHGSAIKGHEKSGSWKLRDTAEALGESVGTVSMDIQLARGMRAFPELLKEKSKSTAYKKLKRLQEGILQNELSKRIRDKSIITHPNVINGNCIEVMAKMDAASVDLILTDPPYGIDVEKSQIFSKLSPVDTKFEDGDFETFDLLDKVIKEMYRVLKDDRHMYLFFAIEKYEALVKLLNKHGFEVHAMPLIWDKGSGSYPSQSTSFVHSYEPILHCIKGKRKLNGTPRDIFPIKRVPSGSKIHPTEKPTELLRDLIGFSTLPGETVLDCFAGSGATLVAARECSRQGIGIELDLGYYQGICKRLSKEVSEEVDDATE
jgi:DNA modification methylase